MKKYRTGLLVWLLVLFGVALFQNYLRYGQSDRYILSNSIIYLFVTVLTFYPFGLLAILKMQRWKPDHSLILKFILVCFAVLSMHYLAGTLAIHLLGFYDSFFALKFARQYFGREAFFHALTLAALAYFIFRNRESIKMISGSIGRKELTLQAHTISWIEADDHYLKIYAGETQMMKRETLEKMADDLHPDFIRIHRKYLVNRKQVVGKEKLQRDEFVILKSGERLKVGRSYSPINL